MAWYRQKLNRHSVEYADSANPQKRKLVSTLAPVGYEDEQGNIQPIDMTPERVNVPAFNGWRVVNNGWHYGLETNGTVWFGGRRGQHTFKFRLHRLGYTQVDRGTKPDFTTDFTPLDSNNPAPTYNIANLTRTPRTRNLPDGDATLSVVAEWRDLWPAMPVGEVYARWVAHGDGLKEEIAITQAAREWITANRSPADLGLQASTSWLTLGFQIDVSDIPKRLLGGLDVTASDDLTDAGDNIIEARTALDQLLFFLPIDYAYVDEYIDTGRVDQIGQTEYEHVRHRVKLVKRLWRNDADGQWYLVVGAKVGDLAALPAGDLVFDPTVNVDVTASTDDADEYFGDRLTETEMYLGRNNEPTTAGIRFDNITISGSDTVDSCYIEVVANANLWNGIRYYHNFSAEDDAATFSTSDMPSDRTLIETAGVNEYVDESKSSGTAYTYPRGTTERENLGAVLQGVIDRAGWTNGNAIAYLNAHAGQTGVSANGDYGFLFRTYDNDPADAPAIVINYTAGAGGQAVGGSTATANAVAFDGSAQPGAIDTTGTTATANAVAYDGTAQAGAIVASGTTTTANAVAYDGTAQAGAIDTTGTTATANAQAFNGSALEDVQIVTGTTAVAAGQAFDGSAQPGAVATDGSTAIAYAVAFDGGAIAGGQAVGGSTATARAEAFDGSTSISDVVAGGGAAIARAQAFDGSTQAGPLTVVGQVAIARAEAYDGTARDVLSPGVAGVIVVQTNEAGVAVTTAHAVDLWVGAE